MDLETVVFVSGGKFFENVSETYIAHNKGLFIMTPSGAGKTYFCNQQTDQHWIDGDVLWCDSGAQPQPETEWWNKGVDVINRVEQRCDVITAEAKDRGFWIMGSVNYWLKPDAIVIPEWETLIKQIQHRETSDNYDGGLTSAHYDQLRNHIEVIEKWNTDYGVPKFTTIKEAVEALTSNGSAS